MLHISRLIACARSMGAHCALLASLTGCCLVDGSPCAAPPAAIVVAPRIELSASTIAPQIHPGAAVQVIITPTFSGGPTRVNLTLGGNLPAGVRGTFTPITVQAGGTSTLTLVADSTAVGAGRFVFDVVATAVGANAGLTASQALTGDFTPAFSLSSNGGSVTAGTSESFNLKVRRAAGFTAPVSLSIVPGTVPPGTLVVFTPATATDTMAQFRLDVPITADTGRWLARAAGRYGSIQDTIAFVIRVLDAPVPPEITLVATPATSNIAPGGTATFDLETTRNLGTMGMGNIVMSVSGVPSGATHTLSPVPTAPANSKLTVTTLPTIVDGTYRLTVTARLDTLVRTAIATMVVATPANFVLSLSPSALNGARNTTIQTMLGIQRAGPVTGVTIDAVALPPGITMTPIAAAVTAPSVALSFNVSNAAVPGTYPIVIRGIAGTLTRTTTLALTVPAPPPSPVTIQLLTPNVVAPSGSIVRIPIKLTRTGNAVGQLLELRLTGMPAGGRAWISPSFTTGDSATLHVTTGTPGVASIVVSAVIGAFPPSDVATVTVTASTAPDFVIVPAPQTLNVATGEYTTMIVEVGRKNGFSGAVSFQATGDIAGQYAFRFSSSQTTGATVSLDIYASHNVPAGPHLITIRGTSGAVVREVTMTVLIVEGTTYTPPYYPYGIKPPP
ncbi:MAG: hypothetical protein H7Z40_11325 [Phycisphaerae bacterium]|nr:hypothetical protein [Gemmatimonadaceae bacterium]